MNPNQAYKDREFTGNGLKEVTSMQLLALKSSMEAQGASWYQVCSYVLKRNSPMEQLSFEEAARCLVALCSWPNIKRDLLKPKKEAS
jgi:hypothetical protein